MARHRIFGFDRKECDRQYSQIRRARNEKELEERRVPAERLLENQAIVELLSLKLEGEGEAATIEFLESLGCSDVGKVMRTIECQ
jgi:hypothetical protein